MDRGAIVHRTKNTNDDCRKMIKRRNNILYMLNYDDGLRTIKSKNDSLISIGETEIGKKDTRPDDDKEENDSLKEIIDVLESKNENNEKSESKNLIAIDNGASNEDKSAIENLNRPLKLSKISKRGYIYNGCKSKNFSCLSDEEEENILENEVHSLNNESATKKKKEESNLENDTKFLGKKRLRTVSKQKKKKQIDNDFNALSIDTNTGNKNEPGLELKNVERRNDDIKNLTSDLKKYLVNDDQSSRDEVSKFLHAGLADELSEGNDNNMLNHTVKYKDSYYKLGQNQDDQVNNRSQENESFEGSNNQINNGKSELDDVNENTRSNLESKDIVKQENNIKNLTFNDLNEVCVIPLLLGNAIPALYYAHSLLSNNEEPQVEDQKTKMNKKVNA